MKKILILLLVIFFVSATLYAEDPQSCNRVLVLAKIIKQNCYKHNFLEANSNIQNCSTQFEILKELDSIRCDLAGKRLIERNHFKFGYPEGLAGGFRFDGNLNEVWEILLCRDPFNRQKEELIWCFSGPGYKSGKKHHQVLENN